MLGFTVAHVYCNCTTNEGFEYVWEGFFKAVEKATGKKVQFKVFNETGNILCVILDMEAAQVQGLSAAIIRLKMNGSSVGETTEVDPDIVVQYLIKLCNTFHSPTDSCRNPRNSGIPGESGGESAGITRNSGIPGESGGESAGITQNSGIPGGNPPSIGY
jgi:hypothetical protein